MQVKCISCAYCKYIPSLVAYMRCFSNATAVSIAFYWHIDCVTVWCDRKWPHSVVRSDSKCFFSQKHLWCLGSRLVDNSRGFASFGWCQRNECRVVASTGGWQRYGERVSRSLAECIGSALRHALCGASCCWWNRWNACFVNTVSSTSLPWLPTWCFSNVNAVCIHFTDVLCLK